MRYLSICEAVQQELLCEALACHRQVWSRRKSWDGYTSTPRFADGLMLVCSPIRVLFFEQDGTVLEAEQGDIIYAPEGICYRVEFENGGGDPDLYTVNFRLKAQDGECVALADGLCRLGAHTIEMRRCAEELSALFLRPDSNSFHRQAKLLELLASIADEVNGRHEEYGKIDCGVRLLRDEWNRDLRIERYAAACGMSVSGFYRYFKEWSGMSPNEYRIRMRMIAAQSMLTSSALSVQEIAFRVGFSDPYYFSRCFCKYTGCSPRAFRKNRA